MSTMVCIKDGGSLVLATDSRYMRLDCSGPVSDAEPKIFEVAPNTFLATSGRLRACNLQVRAAREIAARLDTGDIRTIAAELERESLAPLAAMVNDLRPLQAVESGIALAISGQCLLHACILAGRTDDGRPGFVSQSYFVRDGEVACTSEEYFEAPRKIVFTLGSPQHATEAALRVAHNSTIWTDPPESVVRNILREMKESTAVSGGPDQIVCLDSDGARWIAPPPESSALVESLSHATIAALVSMMSPNISGGNISGSLYTATVGTVTITIDPANKRIRVDDSALSWYVEMYGAGVYVKDRTYPNSTQAYVTAGQVGALNYNPATGHQSYATLNSNGRIFLQGADGVAGGVWVDGVQRL